MMTQIIYLLIAFILTAILGKIIIPILKKLKIGQSERLDGPRAHLKKQGTPTMGGIMMIISIVVVTLAYCFLNRENKEIIPVVAIALASIGFGIVGFIDDFKKVVLRNTEGLNPKLKMLGLLIISVIYTMFLVNYTNLGTDIIIPFINYDFILPIWIYIPFTIFVMLAATNAVNLTDGVDGLAGSVSAIMITAISVIAVKLGYENKITCSYPQYRTGWNVIAKPTGDLIDLNTNRKLYALYYESEAIYNFEIKKDGFIVKNSDVIGFLEEKLAILGLTEREAEEFIVYWLPKLQKNKYNYIRFATIEEINKNMPIEFSVQPDTLIRVLMTYKGLDKPIDVEEQKLQTPIRTGFVAVEWGGTEIK